MVPERYQALLEQLPVVAALPASVRALLFNAFEVETLPFGATIAREGTPYSALYVLAEGRVRAIKRGEGGEEVPLDTLRAGEAMGAQSLLEDGPAPLTMRASTEITVLKLDKGVFRLMVNSHPDLLRYVQRQIQSRGLQIFLRQHRPFARLPPAGVAALVEGLERQTVSAGQRVLSEGDAPGPLYIVEEGRLRTFTERDGVRRDLAWLRVGDVFGERSLLLGERRAATVEAVSGARLLVLPVELFQRLLERWPEFRAEIQERIQRYSYKEVARVPLDFAELLPSAASVQSVGPDQVEASPGSGGPFADSGGRFVKSGARIRSFPLVRQIDEMDCGAACRPPRRTSRL